MPKVLYTSQVNRKVYYSSKIWRQGSTSGSWLTNTQSSRLLSQELKQGYKDTDWRVKRSKQQDASSEYTRSYWGYTWNFIHRFSASAQTWNPFTKRYDTTSVSGSVFDFTNAGVLVGINNPALLDMALARFKRKLQSKIGNADLLTPTVELRELRKLITDSAQISSEFIQAFAKIRKTRGRSVVELMQNLWLQYSFAIAPVIADTIKAAEAVNSYLRTEKGVHRIRASASGEFVAALTSLGSMSSTGFRRRTTTNNYYKVQYTFTGGVKLDFASANDYGLAEHLGISGFWEQAPSVAWELMPFSWIADYFGTVGAYLEDTFELPPGSLIYLVQSHKYTAKIDITANVEKEPISQFVNHKIAFDETIPGKGDFVYFKRTVLSALPHRSLRIKSVDEIGRNAVNRLLNLASLLKVSKR